MQYKDFKRFKDCELKLFTPGPVYVPDFLLKELARPNDTHRNNWYSELQASVEENAQKLFYTKNDILTYISSGTGVMESCMINLVKNDEKVIVFTCGAFGDRWHKIAVNCGKNVEAVRLPDGKGFSPEVVKEHLEKDNYAVVTMQLNETSCGVLNPIDQIAPVVKDTGALFCVDAVSGLGGAKIEVDKLNIDVCLGSTQKCLALPAGLALAAVSDAAFEKAETVPNRGFYFDMVALRKRAKAKHQTPSTPPVHTLRALDVSLDNIVNKEGLDARFDRHIEMAQIVKKWALQKGLNMVPEAGYESPTVSAIYRPEHIESAVFVKKLLDKGYRIVNGYGSLKDKSFRIGHMGELQPENVKELLNVMDEILD